MLFFCLRGGVTHFSWMDESHVPLIFYEGGSFLAWKAEDVGFMREKAKVIGCATMTSPWYSKQNHNLALPFAFTPYEIKWCLEHKLCKLVKPIFKSEIKTPKEIPQSFKSDIQVLHDDSEFDIEEITDFCFPSDNFKYEIYCLLKEKGFYIADGSQYACDFAIYKKEPWICHSSVLLWCENELFDTRKLIQHARISDSTLKKAVVAIKTKDNTISFIELKRFKLTTDKDIM